MVNKFGFIHIIPFDFGYAFYDATNMENENNLLLAYDFIRMLSKDYHINSFFELKGNEKHPVGYKTSNVIFRDSICEIMLGDDIYAYIHTSGVGCFVVWNYKINDDKSDSIVKIHEKKRNDQGVLLGIVPEGDMKKYRELMLDFLKDARQKIGIIAKKRKVKCIRSYSGSEQYKHDGLSYVLTIYLIERGLLSDKQDAYLMYSPFSKNDISLSVKELNKKISDYKPGDVYRCESEGDRYTFSWSGVLGQLQSVPNNYTDIINNNSLSMLLREEFDLQLKWFMADNSLDNALKSFSNKTEGLQRINGMLEQYDAEISNSSSANVTTDEKNMRSFIVKTSDIKNLYESVRRQVSIQLTINAERDKRAKKRSGFILSLFMAIFTASSLYSATFDIMSGMKEHGWLFVSLLSIAVLAVVVDYIKD